MYEQFIENFREMILDARNIFSEHLKSSCSFKNAKKLDLPSLILLIMLGLHRSIQIELVCLARHKGDVGSTASKSAFVQARKKLSPELFVTMNQRLIALDEETMLVKHPRVSGFKRVAIDGSKLYLPQTAELAEKFGTVKNQYRSVVMASGGVAYDIDSGLLIRSDIAPAKTSEKAIVRAWLDDFDRGNLLIYDRYYAGYMFMFEHVHRGLHFIMRLRKNLNKEVRAFIESGDDTRIVRLKVPGAALTKMRKAGYKVTGKHEMDVRLVSGLDDKGGRVYYATDIIDDQILSTSDVHTTYGRRWEVETALDALKNKLQLESFSGHSEHVILQDLHASVCMYNLSRITQRAAMDQLPEEKKRTTSEQGTPKGPKWDQKVNHNLTIGLLSLFLFDLIDTPKKERSSIWSDMLDILTRFTEPIRKGRSFAITRNWIRKKGKFLYFPNYKRAA